MLYFSPATGGFYDSRIHAELPADKVEVTAAERDEALNALAPGQRIAAGPDGKPVAAAAPVDRDAALRRLRIRRDRLLRDSDHSQMPDFPIDAGARAAWAVYR
ncbi:MAG: phage tail protein, partial [Alphaproteobacteria bacterium HGW-Alphaproteobacteria-13]